MAGTEAAWQLLNKGIPVILHEMRGVKSTNAHQTDGLAEMVCSNSFRSDDMENNAVGLLHEEMRRLGSLMMEAAQITKVTTGLHFEDIKKLLEVIQALVDMGNTVIIIEHNLDVIKTADWVIDIGPEGGSGGGMIIAEGTPEKVARVKDSFTGYYLQKVLKYK